jgi:hypothetical protein
MKEPMRSSGLLWPANSLDRDNGFVKIPGIRRAAHMWSLSGV